MEVVHAEERAPSPRLHEPRSAGVRAGQPARGRQGRALRALLALAEVAAPAVPRRVSRTATLAAAGARLATSAPSGCTSRSSSSTATTRWPSSAACTWPAKALEHPHQGARVGPADGLSRAVDALRPYADRPGGRYRYHVPAELAGALHERYVATLDRRSTTYALAAAPARVLRAQAPAGGRRVGGGLPHRRSGPRRSTRCAACCPAATRPNVGHLRHRPGLRAAAAAHARAPAGRGAAYADWMLEELRKVIPAFLRRVDLPERGGRGPPIWTRRARPPGPSPGAAGAGGGPGAVEPEEVALTDFDPDGEVKVVAAALYAVTTRSTIGPAASRRALSPERARRRAARLRRHAEEPPPPARPRLRADVLSLRRPRRLRRLPRPAAASPAHAGVAAALPPRTATSCRRPSARRAAPRTGRA